jgi:hypothetical protein
MVDYFSMIFIVSSLLLIIHFSFVALSYMVSKIFSINSLEGFSKHEFQQAMYSLIIIGSIFSGILVVNNLFCVSLLQTGFTVSCIVPQSFSFEGMNGVLHLNVARSKLSLFYNDVRVLGKGALKAYDWMDFYDGLSGGGGLLQTKIPFTAHTGIHAMIYSELFDILSHILIFLKFQELFLVINSIYFFAPFMYLGIILRILPFTRKLGGLLLGITLGLFFVLPYMYIAGWIIIESTPGFGTKYIVDTSSSISSMFSYKMNKVMGGDNVLETVDTSQYVRDELEKGNIRDPVGGIVTGLVTEGVLDENLSPTDDAALTINTDQLQYQDSKNLYGDAQDYLTLRENRRNNSFVEIVARVVLSTAFITLFAVVGTISAIKEISKMLGGDIEIAGLTRLI